MSNRSFELFVMMIVTLISGLLLSFQNFAMALNYTGFYGLCFYFLHSFKYGSNFFLSFQKNSQQKPEIKFILAGQTIQKRSQEIEQEEQFLDSLDHGQVIRRRIISWSLFLVGLWFFHFKYRLEISFKSFIPLVSSFLIVNSFFAGHLLMALMLNVLLVGFCFDSQISILYYFLYGLSFFITLGLISHHNHLDQKKFISLVKISILYISLNFGFSFFFPKSISWDHKIKEKNFSKSHLTQYLNQTKANFGQFELGLKDLAVLGKLDLSLAKFRLKLDQNKNRLSSLENLLAQAKLSSTEVERLSKEIKKLMEDDVKLREEFESLVKKNQQDWDKTKSAESLDEKFDLFNRLEENLNKKETPPLQKNILLPKVALAKDLLSKEVRTPDQEKELDIILEQVANFNQKNLQLPKINSSKERQEVLKEVKAEEKKALWNKVKRFLPLLVMVFVFFIVNYFLRKKGIKKIEVSDQAFLKKLKQEWKQLKRLKLSPREEVIMSYNLFHQSLQKIHYADHETPPSCIVFEDMKEVNPELEKSTHSVTNIFAECFYGNKNVTPLALKNFRRGLDDILKVYSLN